MKRWKTVKEAYAFLGLTLAFSYFVFWGPLALFKIPTISFVSDVKGPAWAIALYLVGGFVPSLLAIFLTWKKEGLSGLRLLGRRIIQFKLGWRWYMFTFLIVIAGTAGQLTINKLLGNTFNGHLFWAQLGSFLPLLILGPLSEEIGWRGYALERLQTRWNALTSSLIVGLVWALWHLPLFMMVGTSHHELGDPIHWLPGKDDGQFDFIYVALQQHQTESLVSDPASLVIYIRCPGVVFRGNPVSSL